MRSVITFTPQTTHLKLAGIKAGKMPTATIIDSGVDVVRADNVDAYIAQFKKVEEGK